VSYLIIRPLLGADLNVISPSNCMHIIHLEDNVKHVRQMQRGLNPRIKDIIQKEIVKFLDAGIIYHIFYSQRSVQFKSTLRNLA